MGPKGVGSVLVGAALVSLNGLASAQATETFPGLSPEAALAEGLASCHSAVRGGDPHALFARLASLDGPAPITRENDSYAVNDMVDFFGDNGVVRSGVAPLSGLIAVVSSDGSRCQIISVGGPALAEAARAALDRGEQGWTWTGPSSARHTSGDTLEILVRPDGPGSIAHVTVRFRRAPD